MEIHLLLSDTERGDVALGRKLGHEELGRSERELQLLLEGHCVSLSNAQGGLILSNIPIR